MYPLLDLDILNLRIQQLRVHREDFCMVTHSHTHIHTPYSHASVLALLLSQGSSVASFPALPQSKTANAAEAIPCCTVLLHEFISQCTYLDDPSLRAGKQL